MKSAYMNFSDEQQLRSDALENNAAVGSIMERSIVERRVQMPTRPPQPPKRMTDTTFGCKKKSLFAQKQQQKQQQGKIGQGMQAPLPSPSTSMPLGVFVRSNRNKGSSATSATKTTMDKPPLQSSADPSSLTAATAKDAESMFAQMSTQERLEKARELQSALSPDTIAFFKNRRKQQRQQGKTSSTTATAVGNKSRQAASPSSASVNTSSTINTKEEFPQEDFPQSATPTSEKQRMADILSNVKTMDELDAAYKAEMGDEASLPLSSSELGKEVVEQQDPFQIACMLLRSTVPRQNLWAAKVVSQHLQEQWDQGILCSIIPEHSSEITHQESPGWPFPVLLPASLRCLLDTSAAQHSGYLLHTFVLKAIYNLLRLRSCIEHVVDVNVSTIKNSSIYATAIYQQCFLDDAIPTPPVGTTYQSTATVEAVSTGNLPSPSSSSPVAYKTTYSSKSAKIDGEAFGKDPSWTLLSRMCIIPRLAQLLKKSVQANSSGHQRQQLPQEALVAICGMLAIIGQRSPGAAAAIVHHPTLLSDLLDLTLKPYDADSNNNNDNTNNLQNTHPAQVALPAVWLLCTLARQSRVVAEKIPFDELVVPLLTIKPNSQHEHELQKWCLVLWRTLLRYELGLSQIQTMITVSAPYMIVGQSSSYSLFADFSTCFAEVLYQLQATRIQLAKSNFDEGGMCKDDVVDQSVLSADRWLLSSAQQALTNLSKTSSQLLQDRHDQLTTPEQLQFWAGQLQFLSAFLETAGEETMASTVKSQWIRTCQEALASFVTNGVLKRVIRMLHATAFVLRFSELRSSDEAALVQEASTCGFFRSFVSLQLCLLKLLLGGGDGTASVVDGKSETTAKFVFTQFASALVSVCSSSTTQRRSDSKSHVVDVAARRGWLNKACFAAIQMVAAAKGMLVPFPELDKMIRTLQFSLLGRLERGDEAMAAVLFSQDSSFAVSSTSSKTTKRDGKFSLIPSVFLKELCISSPARQQLEHSFNLRHGPGISREEFGASKLRSLLSDVDSIVPARNADPLLPIGVLWLWMTLSSSVEAPRTKDGTIHEEKADEPSYGAEVLASCLQLILELEKSADATDGGDSGNYASRISKGAKMYHLLTICLHPEHVLQSDEVTVPASELLGLYGQETDNSFALDFARACMIHSSSKKKRPSHDVDTSKAGGATKAEKLVSEILDGSEADRQGDLNEDETRALLGFVNEVCDAYTEYGPQYDFFTQCVRSFLLPAFPSRIRCQTVRRLGDILSLIPLPSEDDPTSEGGRPALTRLLERSITGSLPEYDGSGRERPEFLDALVTVYAKGGNPRLQHGYILLLCVLVHARHLATCLQPGWGGLEAEQKRLQNVNEEVSAMVTEAAKQFLQCSDKSKTGLVNASIESTLALIK